MPSVTTVRSYPLSYHTYTSLVREYRTWIALVLVVLTAQPRPVTGEFLCPSDWHISNDVCYYVSTEKVTWHQAVDQCLRVNATLVTIKSAPENDFINTIVSSSVWIGLHDHVENNHFTWVDNSQLNFTKWAVGEPNNAGENCVSLYAHYNKGSWNDVNCRKKIRHLCQRDLNASHACADGWSYMSGSCIRFSTSATTWQEARFRCQSLGGDLVVIRNQTELDFIKSAMPYFDLWVGLNDLHTEGVYTWLDETAEVSFSNWHSGEPNNGNNGLEDCVNMITLYHRKGQWATDGCQERYWYVCERTEPGSTNTTNTTVCAEGWVPHNDSCYHLEKRLVSWQQGREACWELGADLAAIESADEQRFLNRHPNFTSTKVWIGLHDLRERDKWTWLNSTQQIADDFTNWARLEPSVSQPRSDCVMLHVTSSNMGRWEPVRCYRQLAFICETSAAGRCPEGWSLYNGHCYHVNTTEVTWQEAEALCSGMSPGGQLVAIDDQQEQRYIEERLQTHRGRKGFWLGLTSRRKANVFLWPNNEQLVWTNWDIGQPTNVTDEKCVERNGLGRRKGQWNDNNCMDDRSYVCQKPAEGEQTFFDFALNGSVYKVVWHQMAQADGDAFCRRHLGHNASVWRVSSAEELQTVGGELSRRVRGTGLQFWVAGDPTDKDTFIYSSQGVTGPSQEPGRRCLMVSQESVYTRGYYWTPAPLAPSKYVMTPRPCCEEKMFICEKRIDSASGFSSRDGGSVYRLVTLPARPYLEAGAACEELLGAGAGLAVVDSEEEQLLLTSELKARHRGHGAVEYWLGGRPDGSDGGQDPGLLRGPPTPGQNCEVLFHDNIAQVSWDKVIFDILPSSCQGAKQFICELKLTTDVPTTETGTSPPPSTSSSTVQPSSDQTTSYMAPPGRVHMALVKAGCTGPCVGLAIGYPFTILITVLLTLMAVYLCKRNKVSRYQAVQNSALELSLVHNGHGPAETLTLPAEDLDYIASR